MATPSPVALRTIEAVVTSFTVPTARPAPAWLGINDFVIAGLVPMSIRNVFALALLAVVPVNVARMAPPMRALPCVARRSVAGRGRVRRVACVSVLS